MALNQSVKNGVVYIVGTTADIEAARAAGTLVVGRLYLDTTTNNMGRAISNGNSVDATKTDVIRWEVTATWVTGQITDAVDAEAALRIQGDADVTAAFEAADTTLQGNIDAEATARANADTTLQNNIDSVSTDLDNEISARLLKDVAQDNALQAEITRATTREDEIEAGYQDADAALETAWTTSLNNAIATLRDTTVSDIIPHAYADADSTALSAILGSGRPDGIYEIVFTSTAGLAGVMTVTGLPVSAPGTGDITYGDRLRIVVDGGVVTTAAKVDDITKAKFDSIDSSISTLNDATTTTAIRGHFSNGLFVSYSNGEFAFKNSTDANNDIEDDGSGNAKVDVAGKEITAGGSAKSVETHFVDLYAAISDVESGLLQADSGTEVVGGFVKLGGELTRTTTFTGAFDVDFAATNVVKVPYLTFDCFTATRNAQGYVTGQGAKTTGKVHQWFDENGDPVNLFVPN